MENMEQAARKKVMLSGIPNTGISLPFFSYGGTALVIQLAEAGIVLSVSRQMR